MMFLLFLGLIVDNQRVNVWLRRFLPGFWCAPLLQWRVPLLQWRVPLLQWRVPLLQWRVPLLQWRVPLLQWRVPLLQWQVPLLRWLGLLGCRGGARAKLLTAKFRLLKDSPPPR
jgi:hypothetical protein